MTDTADAIIVGAGLSGIGAACHLQRDRTERRTRARRDPRHARIAVEQLSVKAARLVDAPETVPVAAEPLSEVPVFWGHGLYDPAIPHLLGTRGRMRLDGLGVSVTPFDQPMGHQVSIDELGALREWIEATLASV